MESLFIRKPCRLVFLAGGAIGAIAAVAAHAQEVPLPELPRSQPTLYVGDAEGQVELDVRRRHRPAFDPVGIPIGSWRLYPSIAADAGYESNLFGDGDDPTSAAFAEVRPAAALEATPSWGQVRLDASGRFTRFVGHSQANENAFAVNGYARYDLGSDTQLEGGADFAQMIERRDSSGFPDGRVEPVHYLQTQVYGRATHRAGDLRLSGAIDYTIFNFHDTKALTADDTVSSIIDQDIRDQDVLRGDLRVDYDVTPGIAVFARGIVQSVGYRITEIAPVEPNLGGKTYTALAGVALNGAGMVRGSVGIGYVRRDFGNASAPNISGLAVNADVAYFATPILTLSAQASRTVEEAVLQDAAGYVSSAVSVAADYEVKRWLVVHANVGFRYNDFRVNPRTDKIFDADLGATYNVDRRIAFDGSVAYVNRSIKNDPFAASYDDITVRIGARFSF